VACSEFAAGQVRWHGRIAIVVRRLLVFQNLSIKFTKLPPNASGLTVEDFRSCGFPSASDTFGKFSNLITKSISFQIPNFTKFKTRFVKLSD
jgi:hypothetical protein